MHISIHRFEYNVNRKIEFLLIFTLQRNISRKFKVAFHAKFVAGERTFSIAPFGYMRHPEEHNKLAVDPDTAWIIEKIFDLATHGAGAGKIARILTAEKIPTPGYFNYKKYGLFSKFYDKAPDEKAYTWTISTVRGTLSEDWSSGRITEYNFKMLSQKYQAEQQELIEKIDKLKAELATEKQTTADAEKWIALIKQYSEPTELTAEMLNTLIEKIVVHEAVKDSDGTRTQEIEIFSDS